MASVSKSRGKFYIRFMLDGKLQCIYGFTNKREAERFGEKVEQLKAARETGDMPSELSLWVARLLEADSRHYAKLAEFGLVEPPPEKHTLGELCRKHRASRQDVKEETRSTYLKVEKNLTEFFGEDCEVERITLQQADAYAVWLRKTPLNRRRKGVIEPYSEATVNRRISMTKQIFHYAKRLGWVGENPFQYLRGGESVNPEKWHYVDPSTIERVIDESGSPKWRTIIALGRFAGVRGSSELYNLMWDDIHWSSVGEPGQLVIRAEKNRRHGRKFRTIPMHPIVERELTTFFERAPEGEPHVFPGMKKRTNFSTMTQKTITAAGIPLWPSVWYNLRKSFCCDLMQAGIDPTVYEAITDHSYAIAMKHYQIAHTARLEDGYRKIFSTWNPTKPVNAVDFNPLPASDSKNLSPTSPSNSPSISPAAYKNARKNARKRRIHNSSEILQPDSQDSENYELSQETKKPCDITQGLNLGVTGLQPRSAKAVNYGVSCVSKKGCGQRRGHGDVEKEIFRLFDCLDSDRRRWLVERLAEMVEVTK